MRAADAADASSGGGASFANIKTGPTAFPLAGVVGQEAIKTALLLCGVNPKIGGVVISGSRGTAKSIMARAVHDLMPPIEIVKGSKFNIDPASPRELDSFLEAELQESGKIGSLSHLETEVVPTPFVQVPLDVLEDRLLGAVDVEKSVSTGTTTFEPGLLAKAHRGVLYVDDINLLDESISNLLLEALSTGWVTVEREGLSVRHPCQPLLIATFNPEEAELREHLMDRIGVCLNADAQPLDQDERLDAVQRALDFTNDPQQFIKDYAEDTESMRTSITFAREYLKGLNLKREQYKYLCENAIRAGVQGNRGELFAAQVARANAALSGEDIVTADDLQMGVKLCIAPRGTEIQAPQDDDEMMAPPPPPPPPPSMDEDDKDQEEEEEEEQEPEAEQEQDDSAPQIPEEFMFDVEGVALDPDVMKFANKAKSGRSGSRGMIFSDERGRYIKPVMPKGKVRKLAVDATMRTAAPYQKKRRERKAEKTGEDQTGRVFIEPSDVRQKKMARKAGSLVIFVVDASGSMALNRMNAAKGAAINLLAEAYQSRDKICLITFQGEFAQVVLPPTRSISMAKNRLERMPCGGGSPLAHALNQAALVGMNAQKSGDVGEVLVVCISDGRANVPLCVSVGEGEADPEAPMDKKELKEEVLQTAKMLGMQSGFKLLMLDTENKFVSTGVAKEIAAAAQGKYHYVPKASEKAVASVASQAISELRG
jgi:magnesium chelatase subunit D